MKKKYQNQSQCNQNYGTVWILDGDLIENRWCYSKHLGNGFLQWEAPYGHTCLHWRDLTRPQKESPCNGETLWVNVGHLEIKNLSTHGEVGGK